ncbi:hypothetical protein A8C75_06005 [Marinobacterium aestuarii]|uniref:Uncharacterized protein n=1 Tax=Marinobacterium aestuarii TaxID=1821621 RepID=A0A1A9EX22_9GAMM|nr:hypothetical protein A8C75_06005 [Marinobacterium aestuarii]
MTTDVSIVITDNNFFVRRNRLGVRIGSDAAAQCAVQPSSLYINSIAPGLSARGRRGIFFGQLLAVCLAPCCVAGLPEFESLCTGFSPY